MQLLGPHDPPAMELVNGTGRSQFLLTCDHAGNRLPQKLGTLGLSTHELGRHIAWDIGAAALARGLARRLDATLVLQTYSRLVVDCNRPPDSPTAIPTISEITPIPGNRELGAEDVEARRREIFQPYHERIAAELDTRASVGTPTILIAVHSFTPEYKDVKRPWQAGVLYDRDPGFALIVLDLLRREGDLTVGDNEPYAVSDLSDYTVPVHAERRGLPYVELEIRQDLISDKAGQNAWVDRLARLFVEAGRLFRHGDGNRHVEKR